MFGRCISFGTVSFVFRCRRYFLLVVVVLPLPLAVALAVVIVHLFRGLTRLRSISLLNTSFFDSLFACVSISPRPPPLPWRRHQLVLRTSQHHTLSIF